ncbi:branched-chain amino acid transport system substrate-binding protein [Chromobacterium alkanivorans]|uniref:ABC transporter substrate-binding protein n=1 Tax=Chromobacterium alkanivorans TaxID=1071719 RepID=UPI002167CF70|nr:ABC transporter substrate-binding protein [Chromobacterium alkanivorans]MCS3803380.1 branched-chain amino acid transport system substrate-binding protein [Chromobacterium alkanivorans]MCS3817510.1 branched-chain amino acid transport system substrate-binding protein [Chromobacterium alkanivorans]MCS3872746.1 branched-chain amino acid transport system substrate-binding protein [Chromobacterium alkanivorans]
MRPRQSALLFTAALLLFPADSGAAEFLVGVPLSLSGNLARVGGETGRGIETAAALFNQAQNRHQIKLLIQDDESSPAKAVAAVERMASQGALAITGGYSTNIISPASDSANKLGLVYLTTGSATLSASQRGLKTFFRLNDNKGYIVALSHLLAELKVASAAIIHSTKDANLELAEGIRRRNPEVRISMHPFDPSLKDFKPLVNKVRLQDRPDVIVMVGYENDYVGILRAARLLRPPVKAMIGAWGIAAPKMAVDFPELVNNVLGTTMLPYPVSFSSEEGNLFAAAYRARYRRDPDYLSELGYVQGQILFEAIARAADKGSLRQPGGLVAELRATRRDTLIGPVSFDANGDNPNFTQYIGQHQGNGRVELVSPRQKATGKLNLPAVPW